MTPLTPRLAGLAAALLLALTLPACQAGGTPPLEPAAAPDPAAAATAAPDQAAKDPLAQEPDPWPELTREFGAGTKIGRYWQQDGLVVDTRTRLMWERSASPRPLSWGQAVHRCERLELSGHKDWRMPTIRRLRTLLRGCAEEGQCGHYRSPETCKHCRDNTGPGDGGWFMQQGVWQNPQTSWFWSASKHPDYPRYHWAVFFSGAYINYYYPNEKYHVRCVRKLTDGQAS